MKRCVLLAAAAKISRLDIVTLNHDLLLERALGESYTDGFVEQDGDGLFYGPKGFEPKHRIWLLKLHGSINWWRSNRTGRYFIPSIESILECKDSTGEQLSPEPRPVILIGSFNKLLDYRFGIFAELHFQFFQVLRKHTTIVMSGYSWNDIGINAWLSEWFASSPQKRLILLHHKQPGDITIGINTIFRQRFRELLESGRITLIQKWISEISTDELLETIRARRGLL